MDTLAIPSIQWAIENHHKFGDTDIFAPRQEFEALYVIRDKVAEEISSLDFGNWMSGVRKNIPVPKPDGTFRISTYLHPLDSIAFLASLHEHFKAIEEGRIQIEQKVAFSYRLDPRSNGSLFSVGDSWNQYKAEAFRLATLTEYPYVLVCDIADFYNQIYIHRVQNSLASLGIPKERCDNIESFLSKLNGKTSRGTPVGPAASIVISEVILDDIDKWIMSKKVSHVRYADDFKIFFRSYSDALVFLERFSSYLYSYHRLILQPRKTRILKADTFLKSEDKDPERLEVERKSELFKESLAKLVGDLQKEITAAELDDDEDIIITFDGVDFGPYGELLISEEKFREFENKADFQSAGNAVRELFASAIASTLDLGLARFALGRAAEMRTDKLIDLILSNWDVLAPVMRQVCQYIRVVRARLKRAQVIRLSELFRDSNSSSLEYVRRWILWLVVECYDQFGEDYCIQITEAWATVDDSIAKYRLLGRLQKKQAFNEMRERLRSLPVETKRAILLGSKFMPITERRFYVEGEGASDDLLDSLLATFVMS